MKQTVERLLAHALGAVKQSSFHPELNVEIKVERSKDKNHGDFATNLALVLANACQQAPHQLAELLIDKLPVHPTIERVELAGPGFINFFMCDKARFQIIADVLRQGEQFGRSKLSQGPELQEVGSNHKPEQPMDFDRDLAMSESNDNPFYSIQYAHARISSVLRQLHEQGLSWNEQEGLLNVERLVEPQEMALISLISRYPEVLETATERGKQGQLAYYLRELATGLHRYYNAVQLLCEQQALIAARLCLLKAVRQVLRNGLQLIGISTPESM